MGFVLKSSSPVDGVALYRERAIRIHVRLRASQASSIIILELHADLVVAIEAADGVRDRHPRDEERPIAARFGLELPGAVSAREKRREEKEPDEADHGEDFSHAGDIS